MDLCAHGASQLAKGSALDIPDGSKPRGDNEDRSLALARGFASRESERSAINLEGVPRTMPVDTFMALRSRDHQLVSRDALRDIANHFHNWVKNRAQAWGVPVLDAPDERRDEFIDRYFQRAEPDAVVAILRAREPGRLLIAIGNKRDNRWHLQFAQRWVVQYNFYVNDRAWGRMFVRICPYFPFSARVYLNQHHWLANRLRADGIDFQQCGNAFLRCRAPERLQELADSLAARDIARCAEKWLARFTPFFTARERTEAGCRHRLFFSQVEYCDNLIFHRRAALDNLGARLLDANRTIGQPDQLPALRQKQATIVDAYLDIQQDILETFVDHGELQQLRQPTVLPSGKRIPGLKLDHPRQLAVMQALVRFTHVAAGSTFNMAELHEPVAAALGQSTSHYRLSSLRYDVSKLRAKGLIEKLPHSRRYRLLSHGYRLCLVFLKFFERLYAPLTAGLVRPLLSETQIPPHKLSQLDRLYQRVTQALDHLVSAVGLKAA